MLSFPKYTKCSVVGCLKTQEGKIASSPHFSRRSETILQTKERERERFFLLLFGEVKVRRVFPPPYSFSPSLKQKKLLIRLFGFNLNIAGDSDWTTNTCKSALRLIHHLSERHTKTEQDKKEDTKKVLFSFSQQTSEEVEAPTRCSKSVAPHLCAQKNRLISFLMNSEKRYSRTT